MKTKIGKEQKIRIMRTVLLLLLAIITILIADTGIILSAWYLMKNQIVDGNNINGFLGGATFLLLFCSLFVGDRWITNKYIDFQVACIPEEKLDEALKKAERECQESKKEYAEGMARFIAFCQILKENVLK